MSGIILIAGFGLWVWLGYVIWKNLLRNLVELKPRILVSILFAAVWLVGPWADEYLGQKEFARLCEAMPDTQFLGPVSVGEGPFFDAQGKPKWTNKDEWRSLREGGTIYDPKEGNVTRWNQMFADEPQTYRIADWPVPVLEQKIIISYRTTGQVVLVSHWRGSPGGWLKRATGWGSHAPYQCGHKTQWPDETNWIKF